MRIVEDFGDTEISQTDALVFFEEQVLTFEVSVEDFLVMEVVDGQGLNSGCFTVWAIQSSIWI